MTSISQEATTRTRRSLNTLLRKLKSKQSPGETPDHDLLSSFELLPGLFRGQVVQRVVLAIGGNGCSLFRRPQGGCLHCGLAGDGIIKAETGPGQMISAFADNLNRQDFSAAPVLCIYVPGSFLDEREIAREARRSLLHLVARKTGIKKVIMESLPQFINAAKLVELKSILAEQEIEIAVGLDSADDRVRDLCINKGFSFGIFKKACTLLQQNKMQFSAFALLKPPFLSEQEAIADTVKTARRIMAAGAAAVCLEPNTVQQNTLTWELFCRDMYHPPWLWSIIEVIKQLPPGKEIRVGGIVVYPRAVRSAYNCDRCSAEIIQRIQQYNLSQDKDIFAHLDCTCKNQWSEELKLKYPPLSVRIENIIKNISSRI